MRIPTCVRASSSGPSLRARLRPWGWVLAAASLGLSAPELSAQTSFVAVPKEGDGTLWFQSQSQGKSAGSAQLAALDTGEPPAGFGYQMAWLEWNEQQAFASFTGGALTTVEVLEPGGLPMSDLLGVAGLQGGFVLSTDASGNLVSVVPGLGAFMWTPDKLYLLAIGGGIVTAEVTAGGDAIAGVQGVVVLASKLVDTNADPAVVDELLRATALVYTVDEVYHVDVFLTGGITAVATELTAPGGGSIIKTRGVAACVGNVFGVTPGPFQLLAAAFLWNHERVFLVRLGPALSIVDVPLGTPTDKRSLWGVMPISGSFTLVGPDLVMRGAGLVWQSHRAHIAAFLPALTVLEVTAPAAGGGPPTSIVSGVSIPKDPPSIDVQRQASGLLEVGADYAPPWAAEAVTGHIIGTTQRGRGAPAP